MKSKLTVPQRLLVLISSVGVWLFAFLIFKPWIVKFYSPLLKDISEGPKLFLKHTFIFSTPTALLCFFWIMLLTNWGLIPKIHFKITLPQIKTGLIWGLVIVIATLLISPLLGMPIGFHYNPWSIAGNFFSNFCEEVIFRGLLFYAIWSSLGNKYFAIIISGIIFGLTHEQYPWILKGYVAVIGVVLSYLTSKENNLIPAIVAHDIADWILDLFL